MRPATVLTRCKYAFLALGLGVSVLPGPGVAWSQTGPAISSLSATTLPRSGRLVIHGAGFGAEQGTSRVEIGGVAALTTRWSDTLIAAYVPEAAQLGRDSVQVATGAGGSNAATLEVTTRTVQGRVRWRFQADSSYILQRPSVGPDGPIVAHDSSGFVYQLTPDGGLKWIFKTPAFAYGPPAIGPDGSVYVTSINRVYGLT
jgi:hypothetical protein